METPKVVDAEPAGEIACQISLTVQLTDKRHIVVQTYLPRDAELKQYHTTLDKLGAAVDRQEAIYKLQGLEASLVMHQNTEKQLITDFENIEARATAAWAASKRQGAMKLSPAEQAQKNTAEQNIKRYRVEIEKIKAEIAQCEELIAKEG